jgi:hypothetical protein
MYYAVYGIAFFAGFAMTIREGLWSNTILLINILISGLVAFSYYSPVVTWLDLQLNGQFTYVLDYVVVWVLFVATMAICRLLTGMSSRTRMRFRHPIEPIASPIMGLLAAWVLSSFTMATLHLAPMGKEAFGGKLVYGTTDDIRNASPLTAPDVGWLKFVERMSRVTTFGTGNTAHFSPDLFVASYMKHRESLEKEAPAWLRVKRN